MSILGKYTENTNSNGKNLLKKSNKGFQMPAVTRENKETISLKKASALSAAIHFGSMGLAWLIGIICLLLGINLALLNKPDAKTQDIEFVLVEKEQKPTDMNTKYRADINSRTGGINDPKKPVSMPASTPSKSKASSSPSSAPKKSVLNKITESVAPKKTTPTNTTKTATTTQKNVQPSQTVQQAVPKPQAAKPAPPTAKPSLRPPMTPKTISKPTGSPFKVPVPSGGTSSGQYATGPVSGSGSSKSGGSSGSGSYSPNPSLAPIGNGSGSKTGSSTGSGRGTGSGTGSGTGGRGTGNGGGNPGGGGGAPGINAIREPDFGPYMRELQRRIKMNWDPPKGNESKRVVLLFKIAKDGRLLSCSVFKSSGLQNADKAALNAVHLAAPFKPLPPEFKGQSIDIQFTFDYNVFGGSVR